MKKNKAEGVQKVTERMAVSMVQAGPARHAVLFQVL